MIVLEGRIERIAFRSESDGYTVARFTTGSSGTPVTVVGRVEHAAAGQAMKLTGQWTTHPRYGEQFEIQAAETIVPATVEGIRGYLQSGIIRGIGTATVNRIVDHFGGQTIDVLNDAPERLREVQGIGEVRAASIAGQWRTHRIVSEIMEVLRDHGIREAHAPKIYRLYGADSLHVLQNEPYRLADDMAGTGFYIADAMARRSDNAPLEPDRARACVLHILRDASLAGHVCVPLEQIMDRIQRFFEIESAAAEYALDGLAQSEQIVVEPIRNPVPEHPDSGREETGGEIRVVFDRTHHNAENHIASRIAAMQNNGPEPLPVDDTTLVNMIEARFLLSLSIDQRKALEKVLQCRVAIITGGPGTGKTTLIKSIAAAFSATGSIVCLAAPTGRAARRIAEVTQRPAYTIHRLLGFHYEDGCFEKDPENPVEADVIIVDEASMIDALLMHHLLAAIRPTTRLVLVGDMFQLPPVGPGNVLSDLIDSDMIPVCRLNEIFRQAGKSPIVAGAHRIREGGAPDLIPFGQAPAGKDGLLFIEADTPEKIAAAIVSACSKEIPRAFGFNPSEDIQVVSPVHKGAAGTIHLNRLLQAAVNPGGDGVDGVHHRFKAGDRVMHLKNNYKKEVFNGDIGTVADIDPGGAELRVLYDGRPVSYTPEDIDELGLGYAITVHKSQGSEYPAVVMPLTTKHYTMLQRNLLYTAVTRARQLAVLVGTEKALSVAIRNNRPRQRFTSLADRLRMASGHTVYI